MAHCIDHGLTVKFCDILKRENDYVKQITGKKGLVQILQHPESVAQPGCADTRGKSTSGIWLHKKRPAAQGLLAENLYTFYCLLDWKRFTFSGANEMIDRYIHFHYYERIRLKT